MREWFCMNKLVIPANTGNLGKVLDFVSHNLDSIEISLKNRFQLELAIEEAYVNIAKYAYGKKEGDVLIEYSFGEDHLIITIKFTDCGIPYNPLEKGDPDIVSKTSEKEIGGLGIYLIKKNVDYLGYEYINGKNILTIQKKLKN